MSLNGPNNLIKRKGRCSAHHNNCGAHAFIHIFSKRLLNDELDPHLDTPPYQLLLSTIRKFYELEEATFGWKQLKEILCYYKNPHDREVLLGDAIREFYVDSLHLNEEFNQSYSEGRFNLFKTILTYKIAGSIGIKNYGGLTKEDINADRGFINHTEINKFIKNVIQEFKSHTKLFKLTRAEQLAFLDKETDGFYDIPEIQVMLDSFWKNTGYPTWHQHLKTPGIYLPVEVLNNGLATLGFNLTITTKHGDWMPAGHDNLEQRPFDIHMFNQSEGHYEILLDTEGEAALHNRQIPKKNTPAQLKLAGCRLTSQDYGKVSELKDTVRTYLADNHTPDRWVQLAQEIGNLYCDMGIPEGFPSLNLLTNWVETADYAPLYQTRQALIPYQFSYDVQIDNSSKDGIQKRKRNKIEENSNDDEGFNKRKKTENDASEQSNECQNDLSEPGMISTTSRPWEERLSEAISTAASWVPKRLYPF